MPVDPVVVQQGTVPIIITNETKLAQRLSNRSWILAHVDR
jgi:hypothetical protein